MEFSWPPGATPIDPDEAAGLIPRWVTTQAELNAVEQDNVLQAYAWLLTRRGEVLSEKFIRDLHQRMFGEVWKWAGQFRRSDKNIGVDWHKVPVVLAQLLADVRYWSDPLTYPWDELGARFHHRLVSIHCFANGNGRHARLATDALLAQHGQKPFSWGAASLGASPDALSAASGIRSTYIAALKLADQQKFEALLAFVRS